MLETTKTLWYLVEEALAELVHGALQLAALALPLLVVSHRLGCGPLPRGGSGVVVHIVEPAPLVNPFLPAARGTQKGLVRAATGAVAFNKILLIASRVGGCIEKLLIAMVLIYGDKERQTDKKRKENSEEADRE